MNRIIPVFIPHLGCPHACVFCDQKTIAGEDRAPEPSEVRDILRRGIELSGKGAELAFYGGSFSAIDGKLQEAYLETARPFLDSGDIAAIRCSTRPDAIDDEVLDRFRRYGLQTVELGAQSMDDRVLLLSGRGHTAEMTKTASSRIKKAGFDLILQLMCGLPGATRESDRRSAEEAAALEPDGMRIYPVVVVKGPALERMMHAGEYIPLSIEEAVERSADMMEIFEEKKIPAIRIGLNPNRELTGGMAVAGAYHPALGEMVKSRMLRRKIDRKLDVFPAGNVCITVRPACISQAIGQKKENILYFQKKYPTRQIRFLQGETPEGTDWILKEDR